MLRSTKQQQKICTANWHKSQQYVESRLTVEEFDKQKQQNWYMPKEYKDFDIAKWLLDPMSNDEELQRAGKELLVF